MNHRRVGAFYRVEGIVTRRSTLGVAAWMAANQQHIGSRIARVGSVALAAPFMLPGPLRDGALAARLTWMSLRNASRDRLEVLGEEYFQDNLKDNLSTTAQRLLAASRERGHLIVLVSESLDVLIQPLATHLGADAIICNQLEMRNDRATGRLVDPVFGGHLGGERVREFAAEHHIDLTHSCAYGARHTDSVLLGTVGQPCTVNPDAGLRRIARDLDWPVVED